MLATSVFGYAADKKKASGRALGTLIEIVTFYTLCAWDLRNAIAIEKRVPEFANPDITHNVEFSLHPITGVRLVSIKPLDLPITSKKLIKAAGLINARYRAKLQQLLTKDRVMRNAAVIAESDRGFTTANLAGMDANGCTVALADLLDSPFAIFECKRVGVEEGMKKGPQTIEKAKQGAYVARSVSSLQKFRLNNGKIQGILDTGAGRLRTGDYDGLLRQLVDGADADALRSFILTVGVVSNHGNWFTAEDHNKELRVLAQSYDWLLFLTDRGLCQFVEKLLVKPVEELEPARDAFLASYRTDEAKSAMGRGTKKPKKGKNCFTKVTMRSDADAALKRYFTLHEAEVESWFNVIAPRGATIQQLRDDVVKLAGKDWGRIRQS